MKNRTAFRQTARRSSAPRTGEHCPISGWWAPTHAEDQARFIMEGSIMPSDSGDAITWMRVGASRPGDKILAAPPLNVMLDALP